MGLEAGEGGGSIVQDDHQDIGLMVDRIDQGIDAGMVEGGIPAGRDHPLLDPGLAHAGSECDAGTHAVLEIEHLEGREVQPHGTARIGGDDGVRNSRPRDTSRMASKRGV